MALLLVGVKEYSCKNFFYLSVKSSVLKADVLPVRSLRYKQDVLGGLVSS